MEMFSKGGKMDKEVEGSTNQGIPLAKTDLGNVGVGTISRVENCCRDTEVGFSFHGN